MADDLELGANEEPLLVTSNNPPLSIYAPPSSPVSPPSSVLPPEMLAPSLVIPEATVPKSHFDRVKQEYDYFQEQVRVRKNLFSFH